MASFISVQFGQGNAFSFTELAAFQFTDTCCTVHTKSMYLASYGKVECMTLYLPFSQLMFDLKDHHLSLCSKYHTSMLFSNERLDFRDVKKKIKRINNAHLFSQPSLIIFTMGTNDSDHVCILHIACKYMHAWKSKTPWPSSKWHTSCALAQSCWLKMATMLRFIKSTWLGVVVA